MKILALETATEACSAALLVYDKISNSTKIAVRFILAPREHTKRILPMLDEVLNEAGIELKEVDVIAFGCGPGGFTGLRIAAGLAQGIALSVDKPVVLVSTLAALAQQSIDITKSDDKIIIVAIDARMNEVYWAKFNLEKGIIKRQGEEQVTPAAQMLESLDIHQEYTAIGNGWETYIRNIPAHINLIKSALPSAEHIAQLALPLLLAGKTVPAEEAQPIYIRNNVAKKSVKKMG